MKEVCVWLVFFPLMRVHLENPDCIINLTCIILANGLAATRASRVLWAGMQRPQYTFQHISADSHAGLHDELNEADLWLRYERVVPVAERTERQA